MIIRELCIRSLPVFVAADQCVILTLKVGITLFFKFCHHSGFPPPLPVPLNLPMACSFVIVIFSAGFGDCGIKCLAQSHKFSPRRASAWIMTIRHGAPTRAVRAAGRARGCHQTAPDSRARTNQAQAATMIQYAVRSGRPV